MRIMTTTLSLNSADYRELVPLLSPSSRTCLVRCEEVQVVPASTRRQRLHEFSWTYFMVQNAAEAAAKVIQRAWKRHFSWRRASLDLFAYLYARSSSLYDEDNLCAFDATHTDLKRACQVLCESGLGELQRAWRLYAWICSTISYSTSDQSERLEGVFDFQEVMRTKVADSFGFACFFRTCCRWVGISNVSVIRG